MRGFGKVCLDSDPRHAGLGLTGYDARLSRASFLDKELTRSGASKPQRDSIRRISQGKLWQAGGRPLV